MDYVCPLLWVWLETPTATRECYTHIPNTEQLGGAKWPSSLKARSFVGTLLSTHLWDLIPIRNARIPEHYGYYRQLGSI